MKRGTTEVIGSPSQEDSAPPRPLPAWTTIDGLEVDVRTVDEVQVVHLTGELDLATAGGVGDLLQSFAASTIVVDLSGLTFLDSSGIAEFVAARNQIMGAGTGRTFILSRPEPIVRRAIEAVGLASWVGPWSSSWDFE